MELYGNIWNYMKLDGIIWNFMENLWNSMELYGYMMTYGLVSLDKIHIPTENWDLPNKNYGFHAPKLEFDQQEWWIPSTTVQLRCTCEMYHTGDIPAGNQTWQAGKSPKKVEQLMGKTSINAWFSSHVDTTGGNNKARNRILETIRSEKDRIPSKWGKKQQDMDIPPGKQT